jgi:flagellar hook assembly protein FlgD
VPFDPSVPRGTLISVEIAVYDAMGRKIRTVKSDNLASGEFDRVEWDGEDSSGNQVAAGVYLVGMNCRDKKQAQKIIVIP